MLAMPYAFKKYLLVLNAGKNIRPAYGGKTDEINPFWIMKLVLGAHRISERSKLEDQLQTDCVMFRTSLPAEDLRGRGAFYKIAYV